MLSYNQAMWFPCYHPQTKLWEANVSVVSVCPQGSHVTITHDALEFTVQAQSIPLTWDSPAPVRPPPEMTHWGPPSPTLLLTSDGQDWKPVQTCSLEDAPSC